MLRGAVLGFLRQFSSARQSEFGSPMRLMFPIVALSCACAFVGSSSALGATSPDEQKLLELRDTVINLIQALVERGVITRDQAESMIRDAKTKAENEVAANAAQQKAQEEQEKGAVRVPYVPQIVKDEISKEVVSELGPSMQQAVVAQLNSPEGLRSALPDWVQRMHWTGDLRFRGEADMYGQGSALNTYLDFNQVNAAGGIVKAGTKANLNTSEDVDRLRTRLRFGFDTDLGDGWTTGVRLATGNGGEIFVSTNQTEGTYGDAYQIAVAQGWIRWTEGTAADRQIFAATAGRFANPWIGTDMIWYNDLTFEGVNANYRLN